MIQTGLPSTALAAFVGPLALAKEGPSEVRKLTVEYLPHILQNAQTAKFFMNVYFEKHLEEDIVSFSRLICCRMT